jgi:N-acetyltransferase
MPRPSFDPKPVTLTGAHATLVPLMLEHAQDLLAISQDPSIWTWMIGSQWQTPDDARLWIDSMLQRQHARQSVPFAVLTSDGSLAGTTSYYEIRPPDRDIEIGATWYSTQHQRTAINTQCKLLLLTHAFDTLGAQRVTLKTDARNERSRSAIERLGVKPEGILRQYQLRHTGQWRDTAVYSIVLDEWPGVQQRLAERLSQ